MILALEYSVYILAHCANFGELHFSKHIVVGIKQTLQQN